MAEEKYPNRWLFVGAAILMQLCLGNLYTWSIFRDPLMKMHGWTIQQATLTYSLSIAFFALGVIVAGRWQDKVGPTRVALVGGVLLGIGFILASLIGNTLPGLYLSYGVVAGLGVGFAYVTPIATCVKWFPDMRGFITGLAVLGFGAGTMIGAPLGSALINSMGVHSTFAVLGIAFAVLTCLGGAILKNPPAGYKPAGWTPPAAASAVAKQDYAPSEMLKTHQFWLLWFSYLFWAGVGHMVISQAKPMGSELANLAPAVAAGALGTMAIFNGLGRPSYGWISDKIGRVYASILAQVVYLVALLLVLPNASSFATYTIGICMIGFSFGGALAMMPAFTADFFGTKNIGNNYGWVFSAYGAAGILVVSIGAKVRAATGAWTSVFYILAAMSAVVAVMAFFTKAPGQKKS